MATQREDLGQMQVGFDGMAWPVSDALVTIEAEKGPVQGAGITWTVLNGKTVLSVEFQLRGQEPYQIHITEQDDGTYEVLMPPVHLPTVK